MVDCLFCSIGMRVSDGADVEDRILYEDDEFYVKPALGQFIEGYMLMIPKDHYRTYAEMSRLNLMAASHLINELRRNITEVYGSPTIVFEHGAACPSRRAGSCIDHAHLHILPLLRSVDLSFIDGDVLDLHSICELPNRTAGKSYIWYSDQNGDRCIIPKGPIESQCVRKAIAHQCGLGDVWDWKRHPYRERIATSMSNVLEIQTQCQK